MSGSRGVGRFMRLARRDRGASAVEFAIVSIFLVTFVAGMIQFGVTFSHWLELEHAAREGVRWASLRNVEETVKTGVVGAASGVQIDAGDITITPADYVDAAPDTTVTVTVAYDSPILANVAQGFFGASEDQWTITLKASATQRLE